MTPVLPSYNSPVVADAIKCVTVILQHDDTRDLLQIVADHWDPHDIWGSVISAQFAFEFACQKTGLATHPEFRSPYTNGDPDNGWMYQEFVYAIDDLDDRTIHIFRNTLDMLSIVCRLANLDY